jgi:DUF4097 and DUF4098 domain-containing protein YvlB
MTTTTGYAPPPTRSSRGRTAWTVAGTVLALAAIAYTTINVVSAFAFARHSFSRTFSGDVRDVDISNDAGSVHIESGASGRVEVAGKGVQGITKPSHHETLRDGHLDVGARCELSLSSICSMNLTITVPAGTPITVHASGGGITIDDARGPVDASSSGGAVHVNGAHSSLRLQSSGGGITARDVRSAAVSASSSGGGVKLFFITPPQNVQASSSGGGVTIVLPNTADAYRLDVSSSGGGTHRDVRSDPASDRVIDAHSSGGGVTVRYGP